MTARALVMRLRDRGIRLSVDGDTLRCAAPKGGLAPALREELSRRKRELIDYLRGETLVPRSSIRRIERNGSGLPLSFAQQRLWLMSQLVPDGSLYNVPAVLRLRGALDESSLERALQTIVQRHESLRTRFVEGPLQVIDDAASFCMRCADAGDEDEALRIANAEVWRGFDLARGPLFRALLVRIADADHLLALTLHHIVSDGWSMGLLLDELGTLYEGGTLPALDVQYADFAAWQRQSADHGALETALAYWQERLDGMPDVLQLPADRARPAVQTHRGAKTFSRISRAVFDAVKELARRENATPHIVLLAAFQALLHRYTGRTDIVTGAPVAGRDRAEIEKLIGFFVNTLVVRTEVDPALSFRELLARTRRSCVDAYAHQHAPFDKLVEILRPQRDRSHHPLFQVVFVLQTAATSLDAFRSIEVTRIEVENPTEKFDLTIDCEEIDGALRVRASYSTDIFDRDTIDALLAHYAVLLEEAVLRPEVRIAGLPLLTAGEIEALDRWGDPVSDYPRNESIDELFAEQVRRVPDRVAIIDGHSRMTYRELDARANAIAATLAPVCTPVRTERSAQSIVEIVAILKAGGAYVPVDASYPRDRVALMLRDAAATPAAGLAYIIYTSGSTGTPKGVAVPHRAVVRLVMNTDFAHLDQSEVILHAAPLAFDASTLEIWGALLHGGTIVVVPQNATLEDIAAAITRHGVTTLWLTAGLFHAMVDEHLEAFAGVRQLIAGGDVLSPSHVTRVLAAHRNLTVINGYGPTENTTFTCCHAMRALDGPTVPIGTPIRNTRVRILDAALQRVPDGVAGELFTGGDGLACGYAGDAALTAQKFIPDPFAHGQRLYRTGDLVRRRRDGTIEFLGRIDTQVKIRGFRIEPGEIEAALRALDGVDDAVVVVRESPAGKRLVAYAVTRRDANDLRKALRERLPEYMMPGAVVAIEAMPLTANGKIDRRALPDTLVAPQPGRLAPRDVVERAVAGIWRDLLGIDDVAADDDFFHLGGHSLLATRLVSRLRSRFRVELSLATIFEAPTIATLAAALGREGRREQVVRVAEAWERLQSMSAEEKSRLAGRQS